MRALKAAALILMAAALAGCATAALHKITGYAPEDGSCRVLVLEGGTRRVLHAEPVRGKFSVGYGLGDEFPRKVHVQGECNGKTMREMSNIEPGVIGITDLGSIGP